jgi:hypothetical protein
MRDGCRELFRHAEGRTRPRRDVGHAGPGAHRAVQLSRPLLQWAATPSSAGLPQPPSVRASARTRSIGNLTRVSTKPGQVQRDIRHGYGQDGAPTVRSPDRRLGTRLSPSGNSSIGTTLPTTSLSRPPMRTSLIDGDYSANDAEPAHRPTRRRTMPSGRLRQQGFDERAGLDAGPLPRADGPGHPPVRLARL